MRDNRTLPLLLLLLLAVFATAVTAAFLLRFDFSLPSAYDHYLLFALLVWPLLKLAVYAIGGFAHGWWRYVSLSDVLRLARIDVFASVLVTLSTLFLGPTGFPRSIYLLDFLTCLALTCALRVGRRVWWEYTQRGLRPVDRKRTFIYGAGDAGSSLLRELRQNPALPFEPVGFLDDDRGKKGNTLLGCKVLGDGHEMAALMRRHDVDTVLIAIPSAAGASMVRILRQCREAGAEFKTVPSLGEILASGPSAQQVRDVAVEDLLNRHPVHLDTEAIRATIADRTVLVTGAGGSIGAELCRQVAEHAPRVLVGFDMAESALFQIEQEMRRCFPHLAFAPKIGSVGNPQRLAEVLEYHRPSLVLHAAAYKHVPLMETHVFEAIENNVFGTFQLARACIQARVPQFVMISTDKAVRPTNIMGASKRVAELIIGTLNSGRENHGTRFVSVRFGNVLGSNGSVVPTFKDQIARGGPVTVTHPDVQRFFMTIPEAAQLVLQASTLSRAGGEVFVLEMGEPVKIVDLARNLILLSGFNPDEDMKIEFTGLRPGEKLYEELSFLDEATVPTAHERVRCFAGASITEEQLSAHLERLRQACRDRDLRAVVFELKEMVPDYNPSSHLLRRMLAPADAGKAIAASAGL
ncbi:MAG: polysaccharide biosynthesis protein [Terriglobales bacterium]